MLFPFWPVLIREQEIFKLHNRSQFQKFKSSLQKANFNSANIFFFSIQQIFLDQPLHMRCQVGIQPLEKLSATKWSTRVRLLKFCFSFLSCQNNCSNNKKKGESLLPNVDPRSLNLHVLGKLPQELLHVLSTLYCNYKLWTRGDSIKLSWVFSAKLPLIYCFLMKFFILHQNTIFQQGNTAQRPL